MLTPHLVRKYPSPRPTRKYAVWIAFFLLSVLPAGASELAAVPVEKNSKSAVYALKQLSVEELMDIEVTSVSKRPEKLIETPSAIQVVTDEDIRRFGATSIPEA